MTLQIWAKPWNWSTGYDRSDEHRFVMPYQYKLEPLRNYGSWDFNPTGPLQYNLNYRKPTTFSYYPKNVQTMGLREVRHASPIQYPMLKREPGDSGLLEHQNPYLTSQVMKRSYENQEDWPELDSEFSSFMNDFINKIRECAHQHKKSLQLDSEK